MEVPESAVNETGKGAEVANLHCVLYDKVQDKNLNHILKEQNFVVHTADSVEEAIALVESEQPALVLTCPDIQVESRSVWKRLLSLKRSSEDKAPVDQGLALVKGARTACPTVFCIVFSISAVNSAAMRQLCFDEGANMVTACLESMSETIANVKKTWSTRQECDGYKCFACPMDGLSEDGLWLHAPMYHNTLENRPDYCPVCKKHIDNAAIQRHFHSTHGPAARGESQHIERPQLNIHAFALVLVKNKDGRYLLVQERANSGFWLPGGGVDAGERLDLAAIRECKEEAGVDIELTGIARFDYTPRRGGVRVRVIFTAQPRDPKQLPKSIPDYESAGAAWVSPAELKSIKLRANEPAEWIPYLEKGGAVAPMSILSLEGLPPGTELSSS